MPFGEGFGESGEKVCYGFSIHTAVAHRILKILPRVGGYFEMAKIIWGEFKVYFNVY